MKLRFVPLATLLCAALAAVFVISGCKEDAIINSSLTPAIDNVHTFGIGPDFNNGSDTITMYAKTVFQDTIITSNRNTGLPIFHALGSMKDPYAGTTNASIYMQVVPSAYGFVYAYTKLDSFVLELPYAGFTWGDTTASATHTYKVYAINESFSKDSTFFAFSQKSTDPQLLGTATITTGPGLTTTGRGYIQDSVKLGMNQAPRAPHLRIKLDANYMNTHFIPALAYDTSTISSYTAFVTQFPGFYIVEDSSALKPTMPYFRLNGTADYYGSAAVLAYADGNDSLPTVFQYDELNAAHFNRIRRNFSGYPIETTFSDTTLIAMQNGPGATIDLRLPFIQKLPKGVIINKAEIAFTQVTTPYSDDKYFGPLRIYPQGMNNTGGIYTIADRYPIDDASLAFVDGTGFSTSKNGTAVTVFRINIPREVQTAITAGTNGIHLRIGGTVNYPAAYRLVLGGYHQSNAIYKPTINIIYSKQ